MDLSGLGRNLPNIKVFGVAGRSHFNSLLPRGAIERGANVFLGIGQVGEGNLESRAEFQPINILQQLRDDLLVLAVPAFGNINLENRLEAVARILSVRIGRQFADPQIQVPFSACVGLFRLRRIPTPYRTRNLIVNRFSAELSSAGMF